MGIEGCPRGLREKDLPYAVKAHACGGTDALVAGFNSTEGTADLDVSGASRSVIHHGVRCLRVGVGHHGVDAQPSRAVGRNGTVRLCRDSQACPLDLNISRVAICGPAGLDATSLSSYNARLLMETAASPSSSGLGHCPFTAVTGVRTP